jgi:hypothetical protein
MSVTSKEKRGRFIFFSHKINSTIPWKISISVISKDYVSASLTALLGGNELRTFTPNL